MLQKQQAPKCGSNEEGKKKHCVIFQKAVIFIFIAVRTSNLTICKSLESVSKCVLKEIKWNSCLRSIRQMANFVNVSLFSSRPVISLPD
jgi:hypothetical protein